MPSARQEPKEPSWNIFNDGNNLVPLSWYLTNSSTLFQLVAIWFRTKHRAWWFSKFSVALPFVCIRLILFYCWNSWEEFAKWNAFCTCTWVLLFRLLFGFGLFFLERHALLHFHNKTLCSWHHCHRNKWETTRVTFEVPTPWTCSPVSAMGRSHLTGQHLVRCSKETSSNLTYKRTDEYQGRF